MAYIQDLTPCSYFRQWEQSSLAVGWLERGHAYPRGTVDEAFFAALFRLCVNPWRPPFVTAGFHRCTLCQFTGLNAAISYKGAHVSLGTENVLIPGETKVFIAPTMILHYIDAHEYVPPREFQEAVLRCPEMRSMAYLKAIKALGISLSSFSQ
ncbi:hypothetical protein ACQKGO_23030 [Corallococcus interemptor]|uniref:DUF7919 family protein n=1 Tax=Corallococcus interemptor TaxID=2316720 RepID=UPI003CFF1C15